MSRINHNRPQLRYSDNLYRELRRIGISVENARPTSLEDMQGYQKPTVYSKPPVDFPDPVMDEMAAFLAACGDVIEAEIAIVGNANPNKKAPKKKSIDAAKSNMKSARAAQDVAADKLLNVVATMRKSHVNDFSRWIKWLEYESIKNNNLTTLDVVFEYGLKAAFARALI